MHVIETVRLIFRALFTILWSTFTLLFLVNYLQAWQPLHFQSVLVTQILVPSSASNKKTSLMTMMYVVHCVYVYYRRPLPVALSTFSAPLHTSQQRVSNNLTTLLASTVVVNDNTSKEA
jgi:hypothetical protein